MTAPDPTAFIAFFNRHRAQLQHFLDDENRIQFNQQRIISFVDRVLEDWDTLHHWVPAYSREEMTFWFSLYKLESVAEIPQDQPLLPFEEMMLELMRDCRECLRQKKALPEKLFASRPYFSNGKNSDEYLEQWPLLITEDQ